MQSTGDTRRLLMSIDDAIVASIDGDVSLGEKIDAAQALLDQDIYTFRQQSVIDSFVYGMKSSYLWESQVVDNPWDYEDGRRMMQDYYLVACGIVGVVVGFGIGLAAGKIGGLSSAYTALVAGVTTSSLISAGMILWHSRENADEYSAIEWFPQDLAARRFSRQVREEFASRREELFADAEYELLKDTKDDLLRDHRQRYHLILSYSQ